MIVVSTLAMADLHTVHAIDVTFDVRGTLAGETLTRLLTTQVTEDNGQGCIVHSSVFVQITVVRDSLSSEGSLLDDAPPQCGVLAASVA